MRLDNSERDSRKFWEDELENSRTLLEQVDRAIYVLSQKMTDGQGVIEYTIDTGQNRQTVKRADLNSLQLQRNSLIEIIDDLERKLGLHGSPCRQIVPGY